MYKVAGTCYEQARNPTHTLALGLSTSLKLQDPGSHVKYYFTEKTFIVNTFRAFSLPWG